MSDTTVKPVSWIGSSYKDFRTFPDPAQDAMGYALYQAQIGQKHSRAKPLQAVYTVKFAMVIYVLHAFQKKSTRGIATPQRDVDLIKERLNRAEEHHRANYPEGEGS